MMAAMILVAFSGRAVFLQALRDFLGLDPLPDLHDQKGTNCKQCLADSAGLCRRHGRASKYPARRAARAESGG